MNSNNETCKNCSERFSRSYKFCPYCGQQAKDELTVGVLFYNTISNYFSFDARFFKSFGPLVFKPGFIARKFVEGKRLLYLHPAQMYLFVAVIFFFLFSFIQREQVRSLDSQLEKTFNSKNLDTLLRSSNVKENKQVLNLDDRSMALDSLIISGASDATLCEYLGMSQDAGFFERRLFLQYLKFHKTKKGGSVLQTFYDTIPVAMFFLLPIFALILKALYLRHGVYAHHLVFSFYYFSFIFIVFSVILGVNFIWNIPDWIDSMIMLSVFVYLIIALKKFYNQTWFKSVLKASVSSLLFLLVVAPITAFVLILFAFMFY
ncbi:DUF3667 domain-containing protein [Tamlana fucoidanivorans]|uniref:DUF3667 domain-containing protein n=1 Tax=Allotamlana fucoidanivorans TaxID=2583814 RepID=A0A5C4SSG3_9FLAO|nr:DUF3667 domain-containing protein [Tamlana fucoidanivorans]TNJ46493.1 DUF3667 domain-containing protein [Tamlana fucoidanivorans]